MKIFNLNRNINDEDIIEICGLINKYGCDKLNTKLREYFFK